MKYLIEKRNYIILFVIIFLLGWVIFLKNNNKAYVKSFNYKGKIITISIYENINEKEVYEDINKIIKNAKAFIKSNSFKEYKKILENKTNGFVKVDKDNLDDYIATYIASNIADYFRDKKIKKFILNEDGNIIAGKRYRNEEYNVSITSDSSKLVHIVLLENKSMVTLNNTGNYDSLIVISNDILTSNMLCNYLSSLDLNEGKKVAEQYNVEVMWQYNNEVITTDNFRKYIKL